METFSWPIKPGMRTDSSPRINTVSFGDGYEQRKPNGINHQLEKYNVTLSLVPDVADQALEFLKRHGGVKSFMFRPNRNESAKIVVCKKWSSDSGKIRKTISAEFEEVVL